VKRAKCHAATAAALAALACSATATDAPDVARRGGSDYATYCAPCHGTQGNADGPLARLLVPKPARHSEAAFMDALPDDYLLRLLKDGGPASGKSPLMGAWGRALSEQQIVDLIAYLRTLSVRVAPGSASLANSPGTR
jgi:cytochrome c553